MKEKLLIIDNDDTAIQTIGQLARVFNIDTVVMHTWGKALNLLEDEKIAAVFVNVELEMINLEMLIRKFYQSEGQSGRKVPVYFLYSRLFGKRYQKAKHLPHAGELKKPVAVRSFVELLNQLVKLEDRIEYREKEYREKMDKFRGYEADLKLLLQKLQPVME